jgi:type II secretory pathway component GspD/PulD (secretin)
VSTDGSVTLNLTPQVTQPLRQISVSGASTFLLSNRSVTLSAVRVKDGETLVIGGLLKESTNEDVRKVPGLADLPIVGAMFRATANAAKDRTELVLMVTPHILKESHTAYDPAIARSNTDVSPATDGPSTLNNTPVQGGSVAYPTIAEPPKHTQSSVNNTRKNVVKALTLKKMTLPNNLLPMDEIIK